MLFLLLLVGGGVVGSRLLDAPRRCLGKSTLVQVTPTALICSDNPEKSSLLLLL